MDFQEVFTKKLLNDLEQGVYANADDFAAGITKHYMSSLSLNAPLGIPPQMPSPLAAGALVPVGPGNSITNKTREKIFYNTLRVYFVGKELSQGKVRIQSLSQDIQGAIGTYNKLTSEVQDLQIQIQNLDDQFREIRETIQSIVPEFKKFIATKKEIIKNTFNEVKSLGEKFKQLNAQNLSDFDFNAVLIYYDVYDPAVPADSATNLYGVLFLDELPEFRRSVLEVLRQPMEENMVTISRAKITVEYPAGFILIASMNPCPCGFYNHPEKECVCGAGAVKKYLNKI